MEIKPNNDTFCVIPYKTFTTKSDGTVPICCRSRQPENIDIKCGKDTISEIWNSDYIRDIRRDSYNGIRRPECSYCWKMEDNGQASKRQKEMVKYDELKPIIDKAVEADFVVEEKPSHMEIRLGNLCNLKCHMCNTRNSSMLEKERAKIFPDNPLGVDPKIDNWYSSDFFWEDMINYVDHDVILDFSGGEPTLLEEHYKFIDYLILKDKAKYITLHYCTNATNVRPDWLNNFKFFKHVQIAISVEGPKDIQEYVRYPSNYDKIMENIRTIVEHPDVDEVRFNTVVNLYNVDQLEELYDAISEIKPNPGINYLPLYFPPFFDMQILDDESKRKATEKLDKFVGAIDSDYLRSEIIGIRSHLNSNNYGDEKAADLKQNFINYTKIVDKHRGEDVRKSIPFLKDFLDE